MPTMLMELPSDILAACQDIRTKRRGGPKELPQEERLARICQVFTARRDRHVKERLASGIEDVWTAAEDAYVGIDDANRHEFAKAKWCKSTSMQGTLQKEKKPDEGQIRSTIFVRLTARYVDAGTAKLAEILLPPDDKSFTFEPTPVPDLINAKEDEAQMMHPETGMPMERDPKPEEVAQAVASPPQMSASPSAMGMGAGPSVPAVPGAPPAAGAPPVDLTKAPGVPLKVKDLAEEKLEEAKKCAERAEKKIYDWMVEAGYRGEARKVIFDSGKLGVGVMKGPYPTIRRSRSVTKQEDGSYKFTMLEEVVPTWKRISPWDFYPDPDCGENIHNGSAVFERDRISEHQLQELKTSPGFLPKQIDKVIQQGPSKKYMETTDRQQSLLGDERYEIWYGTAYLKREEMELINDLREDLEPADRIALKEEMKDYKEVSVVVAMVNDEVIRAVRNHLESGEFSYHTMPWQRRDGSWAGVGLAEQGNGPQRIVNAATRAMMDNAGVAAGGQIVMDAEHLDPADESPMIYPNKLWYKKAGSTIDDVNKSFAIFTFPNLQEYLMNIVMFGQRLMEESTNIPLISQGQSGDSTPNTLGQTELQNNNANQLLRDIGYTYDDTQTEPIVNQTYEWLLLDPNVDNDHKGDFKINARGSSSLVERSIATQYLASIANLASNPMYGNDPKKYMSELHKSNRVDPRKIMYSEEEQKKIDETPPPPPPQVMAAQIRAEVDKMKLEVQQQIAQAKAELDRFKVQSDTDRDTTYVNAEAERTQNDRELRMQELQLKLELARLDYASKHQISLEELKAKMADTTMKLQVQKELSDKDRQAEALKPPTEPAGRAEAGKSFQQ